MKKEVSLPFDLIVAEKIAIDFGTPIYIYDEKAIRNKARAINKAFGWSPKYKNYFAVKATPNPTILKILFEEGMGFDCSSRAELLMVKKLGISGDDIFYTSNNTPKKDFELAIGMGATVNIDDLSQIPTFLKALGSKSIRRVAARYNPGNLRTGNAIIGDPSEAKYGMDLDQLVKAFIELKKADIDEYCLHTMVVSNELKETYFAETTSILLDAVKKIEDKVGIKISSINLGGGFGLNYKPEQKEFNVGKAANGIRDVVIKNNPRINVVTENGRFVTGPHAYLLTRVRYVMNKYKTYIGVDASMQNLMRPGMYGAYHHITILGKEGGSKSKEYDVVGSLCENNDKFAVDRRLPTASEGDLIVIHDVGAHGHAMGFNYNGLLRSAEVLLEKNGRCKLIRRAETVEDYFSTLVWPKQ